MRDHDEKAQRYLKFYLYWRDDYSEDQVATKLGFGSSEALYRQLNADGFPVCPVCGHPSAGVDHCEKPQRKRRRRARRGTGKAIELPPAEGAADLLQQAIGKMESSIPSLHSRKEVYRDERFETVRDYPNASATYTRRAYPVGKEGDELWEEVCRGHNQDPSTYSFYVSEVPFTDSEGAPQAPPWPLPELIAAYVLAGEPLAPLLEVLHPEPSEANKERLEQAVEELRHKTGQLATLVRGGIIRRGPSTGELDPQEMAAAWHIAKRRQEGVSDAEIYEELKPHGYSRADVSRLGNLRRRPPE